VSDQLTDALLRTKTDKAPSASSDTNVMAAIGELRHEVYRVQQESKRIKGIVMTTSLVIALAWFYLILSPHTRQIANLVSTLSSPTQSSAESPTVDLKEKTANEVFQNIASIARQVQAERIEKAMRESRVTNGMTQYQVEQIWGNPDYRYAGDRLPDEDRKAGVYAAWAYVTTKKTAVLFDRNGCVVGRGNE